MKKGNGATPKNFTSRCTGSHSYKSCLVQEERYLLEVYRYIELRELEENNIRISCRTFVRIQGVIAGA